MIKSGDRSCDIRMTNYRSEVFHSEVHIVHADSDDVLGN